MRAAFLSTLLFALAPFASAQEIYFDFEDPAQLDQWEDQAGFFDIEGGQFFELEDAGGPLVTVTGPDDLTDYTIIVQGMGLVADADWGVVFRFTDIGNFYSWQFVNGALELIMYAGGERSSLFSAPLTEALNEWQEYKAVVQGDTFGLYFNGELMASVTDATHAAGRVGLFAWVNSGSPVGETFGGAAFDNFIVTAEETWQPALNLASVYARAGQTLQGNQASVSVAEGAEIAQLSVSLTLPEGVEVTNIGADTGETSVENGVVTWTAENVTGSAALSFDLAVPAETDLTRFAVIAETSDGAITRALSGSVAVIEDFATIPLEEDIFFDFEDMDQVERWEDLSGFWDIEGGLFYELVDEGGPLVTLTGDPNVTDYSITVQAMGLVADADWGIVFRAADIDNFYSWQFVNGTLSLIMYAEGARSTLFTMPFEEVLNEWQEFRVIAAGPEISLYFNGELIQTVLDSTLTFGRIGLFAWVNAGSPVGETFGGAAFDDFTATGDTAVQAWEIFN